MDGQGIAERNKPAFWWVRRGDDENSALWWAIRRFEAEKAKPDAHNHLNCSEAVRRRGGFKTSVNSLAELSYLTDCLGCGRKLSIRYSWS